MAIEPDPYRTLGLASTASLAEVKAAYRRLAKANHPDTAGEAALPRFLAIQAAYDRLVGPTPGRARSSGSAAAAPRKPWEADPDRRDATYRAYGGRARRPAGESASRTGRGSAKTGGSAKAGGTTGAGASAGGPRGAGPGASGAAGRGAAGATGAGATGASSTGRSETAGDAKGGKPPKRATLGSTSYDGVDREAFEPDWAGANWYGTTSGTYWTINPKEYADPRKHGPEYQARARRAAHKRRTGAGPDDDAAEAIGTDPADVADDAMAGAAAAAAAASESATAGPDPNAATPRHTTASWWDSTSGAAAAERGAAQPPPPRAAPRPRPTAPPPTSPAPSTAAPSPSVSDVWRALAFGLPPSLGWRIARAVIAWIPIALAIGWASGELTGCGRFAATCDPGTAPVAWSVQALALGLLLALPAVAGWGVVAAVICLVVAVPATLFVTASAGAQASERGGAFLGGVLALAWIVGVVGAAVLGRRSTSGPVGPVS